MMWTYEFEPLGTARGYEHADLPDGFLPDEEEDPEPQDFTRIMFRDPPHVVELEEYRIRFFENDILRGMFRLSAANGRWIVPHKQLLVRMHEHRTGVNPISYSYRVVLDDGMSYLEYCIGPFRVHLGPLQRKTSQQFVFVFDVDGGCTGYCRASDLRVVCKAFDQICVPRTRGKP